MYRIGRKNLRRLHPLRTRTRAGTRIQWAIPSIRWAIPGRLKSCWHQFRLQLQRRYLRNNGAVFEAGTSQADQYSGLHLQPTQRGIVTDWQCTVQPKMNPCRATVRQRGCYDFQTGSNLHNHQPQVGASTAAKITAKVKAMAAEDVFRPAPAIVDEVSNTS